MSGYIKLHRKLMDSLVYQDVHYLKLWIHILFRANHKTVSVLIGNTTVNIKQGQFVTSRKNLALEAGIQESKVERILNVLKSEQQITIESHTKFRVITVCSWSKYQSTEHESEPETNSKRTQNELQLNTDKNVKNEKNVKKSIERFEEWWNLYDYKKGKDKAKSKYLTLLSKEDSHSEIMSGTRSYVANRGNENKYWKHPLTFLNGGHWQDEYSTAQQPHQNKLDLNKFTEQMERECNAT